MSVGHISNMRRWLHVKSLEMYKFWYFEFIINLCLSRPMRVIVCFLATNIFMSKTARIQYSQCRLIAPDQSGPRVLSSPLSAWGSWRTCPGGRHTELLRRKHTALLQDGEIPHRQQGRQREGGWNRKNVMPMLVKALFLLFFLLQHKGDGWRSAAASHW